MEQSIFYQCTLCGWFVENPATPPAACPDCGCKLLRQATRDTLDSVSSDAVAHLKKQVKKCWNYDVNPTTGATSYHNLDLEAYVDTRFCNPMMSVDKAMITVVERCKHCKQTYGQELIPCTRVDRLKELKIFDEVKHLLPKKVLDVEAT